MIKENCLLVKVDIANSKAKKYVLYIVSRATLWCKTQVVDWIIQQSSPNICHHKIASH